jgi:uncharacterized membrane protein (DUF485 family)
MFHEPAAQHGSDPASAYKTRLGARLFFVYALVYACFVAINIFEPAWMKALIFWGLNLAVIYGMFLIVFALVLALAYTYLCSAKEAELSEPTSTRKKEA